VILVLGVRPHVVDHLKAAFPDAHVIGDAARADGSSTRSRIDYGQAFAFEA